MKPDFKAAHVAAEFDHASPFITCRFDPPGKFVFATAEDRSIVRWDLADPKKKTVFTGHDGWVWALAVSRDGQTLVTAGADDTLIWWPAAAEKPAPVRKVAAHKGWIRSVAVSPDGKLLASGGNDRFVRLWNLADGKMVQEFAGHELDVYSVTFHPDGKFLLSGDLLGKVQQWDIATGKSVRVLDAKALHSYNEGQGVHFGGVRGLAVSPDKKHLACGGLHKATNPLGNVHEPIVERYDWETHKLLKTHLAEGLTNSTVWNCLFHPDGTLIAGCGGGSGGHLLFWGKDDEKPAPSFKLPDMAREMDLHPDGIRIATVHASKKLRLTRLAPKPTEPAKKA
ncbi:MAG: WD40 repeat domain-containing protein [Proteobacteria bacterium]|nr:WD40 repeat domain-containing protein [Pseudomonadota bacterium]